MARTLAILGEISKRDFHAVVAPCNINIKNIRLVIILISGYKKPHRSIIFFAIVFFRGPFMEVQGPWCRPKISILAGAIRTLVKHSCFADLDQGFLVVLQHLSRSALAAMMEVGFA